MQHTLSFVQRGDPKWTWGVTDILLEPAGTAMTLEIGVADGGSYGNNFGGQSDSNGVVSFT